MLLLIYCCLYLYFIAYSSSDKGNVITLTVPYLCFCISAFVAFRSINDMYYFYLLFKLLNITSYMLLISHSRTPPHFKACLRYYFLGFFASLLFMAALYDLSNNEVSLFLINLCILAKMGVWPFSDAVSNVYKKSAFISYITLSFLLNYIYILLIFIINLVFENQVYKHTSMFISLLFLSTFLSIYFKFSKQVEVKGFTAYSSISNIPLITTPLILTSYFMF